MPTAHVLAVGQTNTASTQFRFVQYQDALAQRGIELVVHERDHLSSDLINTLSGQTVVNQKIPLRPNLLRRLRARAKRLIFDFDDAIWTRPGRNFSLLTSLRVRRRLKMNIHAADLVTAPSRYLLNYAQRFNAQCHQIPMGINLDEWTGNDLRSADTVTIGWAGSPVNIAFLKRIEAPLQKIQAEFPNVVIKFFCGQRPDLQLIFEHTPYQPGLEPTFAASLDIGLCPLSDEAFARGKSPIKLLQYWAAGSAVVANPFGAANEMLGSDRARLAENDDQWYHALRELIQNRALCQQLGQAGRRYVEAHHAAATICDQLAACLQDGTA